MEAEKRSLNELARVEIAIVRGLASITVALVKRHHYSPAKVLDPESNNT